ncbi:hypothetical protein LZ198_36495 [Myxococcus sp. K15C18031901]|uniref:hypothetical protein n=1 Tax=Myxococcus dinghuensis TaxID=2906761 RepID=UPI0020A7EB72|nr:hypothetical protein [Myxococcus dinghuensis]MCP3104378.1 hypothetical protein [Myxococcus dinghuensis]
MRVMRTCWRALALALVALVCACGDAHGPPTEPAPPDADGDGHPDRADCAPTDASRWRLVGGLYPDADGDGATGPGGPVEACVGATLTGYRESEGPADCDDHDATTRRTLTYWRDVDGDGVGADTSLDLCEGRPVPTGYVLAMADCAPEDATRSVLRGYTFRDLDGDGHSVPGVGLVCSPPGSLPPGYQLTPAPGEPDCDDADPRTWNPVVLYVDTDRDGYGTGDAKSMCMGETLPPDHALQGGDCAPEDPATWQWLAFDHRDVDGDGHTTPSSGRWCSGATLPPGFLVNPSGDDCDDHDATVQKRWAVFVDTDGDGVGAGGQRSLCATTTLPQGHALTGTDCAPTDPLRWQVLAYSHRDGDGDGHTIPAQGALCAGDSLPAGYATSPQGQDCDDTRATVHTALRVWSDVDGDGVGAGEPRLLCTNGTPPPTYSTEGTDCAEEDATRWRVHTYFHVDRDGDGATTPERGQLCAQETLLAPYFTSATGADCDDTDASLTHWDVLYPDQDGDGVGAEPRRVMCIGGALPPGLSQRGDDSDDMDPAVTEDPDDDLLLEVILDS